MPDLQRVGEGVRGQSPIARPRCARALAASTKAFDPEHPVTEATRWVLVELGKGESAEDEQPNREE